jgi:hypothetical protein
MAALVVCFDCPMSRMLELLHGTELVILKTRNVEAIVTLVWEMTAVTRMCNSSADHDEAQKRAGGGSWESKVAGGEERGGGCIGHSSRPP